MNILKVGVKNYKKPTPKRQFLEFDLNKILVVNKQKIVFYSRISKNCLKNYLFLARLLKIVLHNYLKVEIDPVFISNLTYTSLLVNVFNN